jgi:DNA replication protein DnaC
MQKFHRTMNESSVVQRFSARTQEEATRICPNCGTIPGREILLQGTVRYVSGICACRRAAHEQEIYDQRRFEWMEGQKRRTFSWLGERWEDRALLEKTLANFDSRPQSQAYQAVQDFIMEMRGNLVLHGTWGTGKTHLLAAICNEVRQLERSSLFVSVLKLFWAIQGKIANHEDYTQILTSAIQTNLLVLDDVDKAEYSKFRGEIYFQIVDERVKAGRPIAISTNRLDELEKYVGGAVCSRLKVGQIDVPMIGIDYRETLDIA